MANKRIYELTSDTGVSMTDNDLIPIDKYVSPGVYTTVYKNGLNFKNYISNYITGLSTASFTNINTSISNIIPNFLNLQYIANIANGSSEVLNGVITVLNVVDMLDLALPSRPFVTYVKIFAYAYPPNDGNVGIAEYRIVGTSLAGSGDAVIVSTTELYKHESAGISINTSGFTFIDGGSAVDLRFSNSHTLGGPGDIVKFVATTTTYIYNEI